MKSERGWEERVLKKRKGEERRGAAKTHRIRYLPFQISHKHQETRPLQLS